MYLKELKQLCKDRADVVNWKGMTRSELCLAYLENKDKDPYIADSYMSALLYSYWNVITYNYMHQVTKIASPEDCYGFIVDGILYVLEHKAWLNPASSLYGDPKGPEKAINKVLDCRKINFFVASNHYKRRVNYYHFSLDELEEDSSDGYYLKTEQEMPVPNVKLEDYVTDKFKKKDYLPAFAIDAICDNEFSIRTKEDDGKFYSSFDYAGLKNHLLNMNEDNCIDFATKYNFDLDEVRAASKYITQSSRQSLSKRVDRLFKILARDRKFMACIQ